MGKIDTLNSYDRIAAEWHASERSFRQRSFVDRIVEGLQAGDRILDLGCGTGLPVAGYLMARGFDVVGLDDSARMLELARQAVPSATLIHADMVSAELPSGFRAAIVWDSLFHVDRVHHQTVYRKLFECLLPGGRLLLSTGGTGSPGFTSEMHGQTFFYSAHTPEESLCLLRAEGFEIDHWVVDDPHDRGHVAILASKPVDSA